MSIHLHTRVQSHPTVLTTAARPPVPGGSHGIPTTTWSGPPEPPKGGERT